MLLIVIWQTELLETNYKHFRVTGYPLCQKEKRKRVIIKAEERRKKSEAINNLTVEY